MLQFFIRRLIQSILLIVGVLILVFFMVRLTGDPATAMLSKDSATADRLEQLREELGYNRPLIVQFGDFFFGALQGDLGDSLDQRAFSNRELILDRLPATLELAITALLLSLVIAVPLGVAAGMRPGSPVDGIARTLGLFGQTIPNFWLAMILIMIFAVTLGWLPSFGRDSLTSLVLPSIALGLASMGQFIRLTRSAVLEVQNENYVRTARAKGLSSTVIAARHIAPNAAIPLISVVGIHFTYMLGGSVYIETVFSWPGLGGLLNTAILNSDFPLVQAITIFIALFAIAVNLLTDLIYSSIDPRIRYS